MRWKFYDPNNTTDLANRNQYNERIERWWEAFQRDQHRLCQKISQEAEWDVAAWMAENLDPIHPQLKWEYGPAVNGQGHRLVITPEAATYLRPLTESILEQAPHIEGWEFYGRRLADDAGLVGPMVDARVGIDASDFQVKAQLGDMHLVDLTYYVPKTPNMDLDKARHAAFVITETLLGEEVLDHWIGLINVEPLPKSSMLGGLLGKKSTQGLVPFERLAQTVQAVINHSQEQLPQFPHFEWVDQAEWTLWELRPDESVDYVAQDDLFVGRSANPAMWMAAHSSVPFHSPRFSAVGETFCYLKIDGTEKLEDELFADKSEIEDALDEVLIPAKLGCHIGGGTGLKYSYIDLALTDIEQGIEVVRQVLRKGRINRRAWIQFFESDWCAEWVGIYDDTPPPPMPDFEP